MKKKTILLLLMVCVLSLMVGLVGCSLTNGNTSTKPESEVESVIESAEESDPTPDIEVAEIQAKNDLATILDEAEGVKVNLSSADNTVYYFSKDAEGVIFGDSKSENGTYTSSRDGAIYTVGQDGYKLSICPNAEHVDCCNFCGLVDFVSIMDGGFPVLENGKYVFSIELGDFRYDFTVNEQSLLVERVIVNATAAGLEDLVDVYTFEYAAAEFEWIGHAFEEFTTFEEGEDVRNFELRIHPLEENEITREFIVRTETEVELLSGYYFYKNVTCTQDIEDFGDILEAYNDFRVYAKDTHVEISFDFTLTEEDVEHFANYIENFTTLAQTSEDFEEIEFARELMEDKILYFVHQYYMGTIKYYKDTSNAAGIEAYDLAVEVYNDAYADYIGAYKTVYELEGNEYSAWLFADWTEEDLAILKQDNEAISELEKQIAEIEKEYNDLNTSSSTWSADVEALYEEFVAKNQEIASLKGYDNAYDYFCQESYSRNYTAEERAVLKAGIRDYVVRLSSKAGPKASQIQNSWATSHKNEYTSIISSNTSSKKNKYISGYIGTYSNGLEVKMNAVYDKKASVFATSTRSQGTAFANYSGYYEEAFTFFGKSYQDVFTFIHELGHYVSFSGYDAGMPYDFAETHSQGNEWMFLSYLEGKISAKVYDYLLYENLNNAMITMLRGMLIDEFEYRVYTAETPYTADQYKDVFISVLEEFGLDASAVDAYYKRYTQYVIINSPCYYLNYVTSSMASVGFYTLAKTEGYEVAQEVYRKLQEDCDLSMSYAQILDSIGLPSPFEIEAYEMLLEVFFPEEAE